MKTKNIQDIEQLSQMKIIDKIIDTMQDNKFSNKSIKSATPYIQALAERLNISDDAATIFPAFFDNFSDSRILISEIAEFYDCNQVKILIYWSAIDELVQHRLLNQTKDSDGDLFFSVPDEVVEAIRSNKVYKPKEYKDLNNDQWITELNQLLEKKKYNRIPYETFKCVLLQLINRNKHLAIAKELGGISSMDDLIMLTVMINLFIQHNDEHIIRTDIESLLEYPWEMLSYARQLEQGTHPLQQAGLVEHCEDDGMSMKDAWKLTKEAKLRFLKEIDTSSSMGENRDRNITTAESIIPKQLYFNPAIDKQFHQLETLLQKDRFAMVQDSLTRHGMRRGFACIFYGAPGTGKTESVKQLARSTGRGFMLVDVPSLRSKWVGDTEKNVKAIFERYKSYCRQQELAPILLFNEADAILCKRKEGAENSVDKMENAMQNIILHEMESLDGIMIATTNLLGNLDSAFERRFLYKIEFQKPTPNESQHIWHSMFPEISEHDAYDLARQYSFSGGQIENIARKQVVKAVLSGEDMVSMESIREACKNELFNKNSTHRIGFC